MSRGHLFLVFFFGPLPSLTPKLSTFCNLSLTVFSALLLQSHVPSPVLLDAGSWGLPSKLLTFA